ncbi:MAG: hypothetical protein WC205_01535 [Opitutaceae bacterium]|jgi:hypothetical protein
MKPIALPRLLALASLAFAVSANGLRATIIASDTFTLTDTRIAGSALSGSTTETGNLTWNGGAQWQLTSAGYVTSTTTTSAGFAVPFSFAGYAQYGTIATVSFDVTFPRNNDSTWYALGFGTNSAGALNSTTGVVYIRVDSRLGGWTVTSGSTSVATGTLTATLGSYNRNNSYTWSVSYDESTRTIVNVSVNGTSIVSNYLVPETVTLSTVTSASFFGQFPAGTTEQIDNFKLEVTPSTIPEPGTWTVICGALSLAVSLFRRRSR